MGLKRITERIYSSNFFLVFGTVGLLLVAFYLFITPRYGVNDDAYIAMVASGYYGGEPVEYLVFINGLMGLLLKALYHILPAINWYSAMLYSIHFLSISILLYAVLCYRKSWIRYFLFVALLGIVEVYQLTFLTFTATAFMAGISGVGLYLALSLKSKAGPSFQGTILSLVMVAICSLLRLEVFYLTMLLVAPLILTVVYNIRAKSIFFITGILTIYLVTLASDKLIYETGTKWHDQKEAESWWRGPDNPSFVYGKNTMQVFNENNWSKTDFDMLTSLRYHENQTLFSKEKIAKIEAELPMNFKQRLTNAANTALNTFKGNRISIGGTLVILGIILLLYLPSNNHRLYWRSAISMTGVILLLLFFRTRHEIPQRGMLPLLFFVGYIPILLASDVGKTKWVRTTTVCLCVLLFVLGFGMNISHSRTNNTKEQTTEELHQYIHQNPDKLFISFHFKSEFIHPLKKIHTSSPGNLLLQGWMTLSPLNDQIKARYGITNSIPAIYNNQHVLIISNEAKNKILGSYIHKHFGQKVRFELLHNNTAGNVYRAHVQGQ